MSRIDLTGEQKKLIQRYLGVFEKFTKTSEFKEHYYTLLRLFHRMKRTMMETSITMR